MPLINEKFPLSDKIHYSNQKLGKEWGIQIVGMLFQTHFNTDFFQSSFIIYCNYSARCFCEGTEQLLFIFEKGSNFFLGSLHRPLYKERLTASPAIQYCIHLFRKLHLRHSQMTRMLSIMIRRKRIQNY